MLAADGVRDQPFFDELQAVVLVLAGVVEVGALEEPALVAAAVRVEVLEREPLAGRELIGEVADDAELRLLGAGLDVVVARVLELAGAGDAEEAAILLEELLLVGVRDAGDDAELAAEAVAERGAPVLARACRPCSPARHRFSSSAPELRDLRSRSSPHRACRCPGGRSCRRECRTAARARRCR